MAEIEKKYSDYQTSECDTQDLVEPIDERLCPTCEIDPDWRLSASHWSMVQEAYLNKSVCEYHVRVYDSEVKKVNNTPMASEEDIRKVAAGRILVDFDKPLNDGTRQQLFNASFIVDTFRDLNSKELGLAYLVAIPAFNMDQIQPNDAEDADISEIEEGNGGEIIVDVSGFNRKLRQLRLSLSTYGMYYATAVKAGAGFVIRQESDETSRINYENTVQKIRNFKSELNDRLKLKGYPKIGNTGIFKSKTAKRIKFVFRSNGKPYDLKKVFVYDASCDKYIKIPIPNGHLLRKPSMRVVYHFLENLDQVINDVTAKETKPWLDFTLANFYPKYIVDRGSLAEAEDVRSGLECLIEADLGLGNGQMVDYLVSEIMSAFDLMEEQLSEQACRSLAEQASGSGTSLAEKNKDFGKTPKEERELAMKARYQKEYENKALNFLIEGLNDQFEIENGVRQEIANKKNVFDLISKGYADYIDTNPMVSIDYKDSSGVKRTSRYIKVILTKEDLESAKKEYASKKFNLLEDGSFGNQIQNSPHFEESMEAASEVIENFDNTFIQPVRDAIKGRSEFELVDVIPLIGLCGMSKIAGKAMECLLAGVSFDDFMDMLIEKTFDFMEVNTLGLFLNGLPYSFRTELNETIEEQFGPGVDITSLLGIKQVEGGGQKMRDFVKSKQVAKRILELFEKYEEPLSQGTDEEKKLLKSSLGHNTFGLNPYDQIAWEMSNHYNRKSKVYIDGPITRKIDDKEREYKKREKFVLKFIKNKLREYKKSQNSFRKAMNRVASSIGSTIDDVRDSVGDIASERREIKDGISSFESLIEKERSTIDAIRSGSSFNEDGTISSFPLPRAEQLRRMKEVAGRVVDYKSVISDLEEELDGFVKDRAKEEVQELKNRVDFLVDQASQDVTQNIAEALRELDNLYQKTKQGISRAVDSSIITSGEIGETPEGELNPFEQAAKNFQETALGVKVDVVFDVIFDFVIDSILGFFSVDDLFERMRSVPAVDFAIDKIEDLFIKPCPVAPVIYPPANDFMKSLSIDVCNPNISLSFPKIILPNIDARFHIEYEFGEIFREAIIKLATDIALNLLKRLMSTLESALCKLVEGIGGIVADGLQGNLKGSFYRALNEAFCNDGQNPETSQSKAEELAEALFAPFSFDEGGDYTGSGARVSNIISSVATTKEFLEAMVAYEGEENDQFNQRISNAISTLSPEMEVLLGDPNQVAYFFKSLGSFLPPEDRSRIRDLLDAGVPNLPMSEAICLTNDQLDEWNRLREDLLTGGDFDPSDTVRKLNEETLTVLGGTMDDVALLEKDGPFIGAATNEILKDVCNPNNVFNDSSQSQFDREQSEELIDGFFDNISKSLTRGFMSRGGLLAEAMRDTEGRREFGRSLQKLFRLNYGNSQEERDQKYTDSWAFPTQFIMGLGQDENEDGVADVQGRYPNTVAIKQRKEILEGGMIYDFDRVKKGLPSSRNVVYRYIDAQSIFSYKQKVAASNLRRPKKTFGYNLQVTENIDDEGPQVEININTPVPILEGEGKFMESKGFQYKSNEKQDIRKEAFQKILQSEIPISKDFSVLFEKLFETSNKNIVKSLLTNGEAMDGLPVGYKYGYVTDTLTEDSFEYTPSEKEDELGTFASPRIIPLDPKVYGGRYSNPPYYVEPRRFTGWLELATSAFESRDGCDPKTPPLLSFMDIKERTKNLDSSLVTDPRLSKPRDCISNKPFHLLLNSKSKAVLDGVIRTTIRTYIAEFFMKGYGLFSNLQIRPDNFDASLSAYISKKMQMEMQDLGAFTSNRKVRIVRERYWYTFLEQCVEAYQRMVDVDKIEPPEAVFDALNRIQLGLDKYRSVDKVMKKKLRKEIDEINLVRPAANYDPLVEIAKGPRYNLAMAVAFRLADEEERENFFNGSTEEKIKGRTIRYAKLKKLQFFQKIYFIKLFEKEALLIMSEFVRDELNRMSELVIDGPTDKPYYFDLYKSFFGMESFFGDQSSSRVGLNSYYLAKQEGKPGAGSIRTIKSSNESSPFEPTSEPQYVIESYVRLEEREQVDIPDFIRTRQTRYLGAVSTTDISQFINENLDRLEGKSLSDYFGNLSFTYTGSFRSLMDKGFTTQKHITRLTKLNKDTGVTIDMLTSAFKSYVGIREFDDFDVIYDESFLLPGETPEPTGTVGSTGVKYGLRVSIVLPQGTMSASDIERLKQDPQFMNKSKQEKAFLFDDGAFMMPLSTAEIDVIDAKFEDFDPDPLYGTEPYDLECLINKIVEDPSFTVMFDKLMNFRQASSMLAIYCMETLPASIGRDESEREFLEPNPDVDDWDRTVNKFGKNFLRREFKSLYLSETEDGQSDDDDDDKMSFANLFQLNNPFDFLSMPSVKLPWWMKRRMKTKIYDANGQECADPEKDLQ